MSQDSVNSMDLMSQETYDVLQSLIGADNNKDNFVAKYRFNPYDVQLVDENNQENVHINIERLFSFPKMPSIKSEIDFGDSPPDLNTTPTSPVRFDSPPKTNEMPQYRPITSTAVTQEATVSSRHCFVPPNTDFPGEYQFDVGFQEERGVPVKSAPWTYSPQLKKLFVKMRSLFPIRFIFKGHPPPGSYIKCIVVFQQPEHFKDVVERCLNHITKYNDGHQAPKHLMRCENQATKYETCPYTGRHSISIPLRQFEAGVSYFTEMIQYMCFNSCPGGLNRRSINTIFNLEHNGQVLGRKVLDSRICACPGRDRGNEETADVKKASKTSSTAPQQHHEVVSSCEETPPPTPGEEPAPQECVPQVTNSEAEAKETFRVPFKRNAAKITEGFQLQSLAAYKRIKREEDEEFTLKIRGREKYELLLKIKEGLDLMDMVPQSFVDNYRASCPPCGPTSFVENQQKGNASSSQYSDSEGSPPSTFPLSQLSRTSSNASTRSNPDTEYSTVRFTLKRTVSLDRKGLKRKDMDGSER